MKTNVLLLTAAITTLSLSSFATDALLTPRAQGNQPRLASVATPAVTVSYAAPATTALLTPRAAGNQSRMIAGTASDSNPALACRSNMPGTPRVVAECSQHTTMPGCAKVIALK